MVNRPLQHSNNPDGSWSLAVLLEGTTCLAPPFKTIPHQMALQPLLSSDSGGFVCAVCLVFFNFIFKLIFATGRQQ